MTSDSIDPAVPPSSNGGVAALLRRQQAAFHADMSPSRSSRAERLRRLAAMIAAHATRFAAAISDDFGGRSSAEIRISETLLLDGAIRHALRHLPHWMQPQRVPIALAFRPGRAFILRQPLGVIGVISPWNYPLQLALAPVVGALAAGNRVMLKTSELTPRFSAALQSAVGAAFAADEVSVVTGDAAVGKAFAALPFDHLVFTGSARVGREVARAAADNLTPVTLELGGKSPVIIDASCPLGALMDRIAWGKLLNAGQTCIAPDYALVPRAGIERFVAALRVSMTRLYPTFRGNPDYSHIIDAQHLRRLHELVADAVARGARAVAVETPDSANVHNRQLAPVLLLDVDDSMRIMREEIFGPLLPIIPYDRLTDALNYVNRHDRPLALYWFGTDPRARAQVLAGSIAGGVSINETMLHQVQENLPFGGVGPSGQGRYHGEFGFRQFSHEKSVFLQSRWSAGGLIRPPYKPSIDRVLEWLSHFT